MTAFEAWASPAGQIGNDAFPPTEPFLMSVRERQAMGQEEPFKMRS